MSLEDEQSIEAYLFEPTVEREALKYALTGDNLEPLIKAMK